MSSIPSQITQWCASTAYTVTCTYSGLTALKTVKLTCRNSGWKQRAGTTVQATKAKISSEMRIRSNPKYAVEIHNRLFSIESPNHVAVAICREDVQRLALCEGGESLNVPRVTETLLEGKIRDQIKNNMIRAQKGVMHHDTFTESVDF